MRFFGVCLIIAAISAPADAALFTFQFEGTGGMGLLPTNENGTGAETSGSVAFGDVNGSGIRYDSILNRLDLSFGFSGLTSGLREQAAGGIHLHGPASFTENAGIVFALNNGTQPTVTTVISGDELSGQVTGFLLLDEAQETILLNNQFYVNIHSDSFFAGELRGNLIATAVPEPSCLVLGGLIGSAWWVRRRRRRAAA